MIGRYCDITRLPHPIFTGYLQNKFMNLQTTHTKTVTSLQRELEALRESLKITKIQLRDLEMGNDDLERHERYVFALTVLVE
jgi:hypothetical protein